MSRTIESERQILTPDITSLLELYFDRKLSGMNCLKIGTIESFDASAHSASISINYRRRFDDDSYKEYPLLVDCPCMILTGGEGHLTFPIAKGDTCLILFNDSDIDQWFSTGQVVAPNSNRVHDIADGIAIVGIRSMINVISGYKTDGVRLKHSTNYIDIDSLINMVSTSDITATAATDIEHISEGGDIKIEAQAGAKRVIINGGGTFNLRVALDALCDALYYAIDTAGHAQNATTKAAILAAKALIDGVLG